MFHWKLHVTGKWNEFKQIVSNYYVGVTNYHRSTDAKLCKKQGKRFITHIHFYSPHKTNFTYVTWYLSWGHCKEIKSLDSRQGVHLDTRHRWKIVLVKKSAFSDCTLHTMLSRFRCIYNHLTTVLYDWARCN